MDAQGPGPNLQDIQLQSPPLADEKPIGSPETQVYEVISPTEPNDSQDDSGGDSEGEFDKAELHTIHPQNDDATGPHPPTLFRISKRAVTAMHDALALANLLYAMPTETDQDVSKVFEEYQKVRLPAVMEAFNYSQGISKILGRGIFGAIYLYVMTHMPTWLWRIVLANTVKFRPQVGCLKAIEVMGNLKQAVTLSGQKARVIYEERLRPEHTAASI
ncbi:hypothetical protein BG015_006592 [Linnemannia schmuckeri]|uniref:Uncharacterized protein n=1 Tax=Linnemannia schmuckeri TaxID=64567 RepID=A0A9P5S348_9FUNG|nr:hypothetical protein BG015_006592 [Linnemannia schmuckeri]